MNLQLQGKIIIISGGASGIGKGIAKALAIEDAVPCIIDRNQKGIDECMIEIEASGKKAFSFVADLTDPNACQNAIDYIIQKCGKIDGLVNNAGLNDGVGLENGSYQAFVSSLEKNVGHYYTLAHSSLPYLKESEGVIVNIVSKTFTTGQGGTSGYAAANGIRASLTEDWARELKNYGIRVNSVVVAECWTPQYEWWINQNENPADELQKVNSRIPLHNRMTTIDEVANMAVFLLSKKSNVISGQAMYVDGGYVHLDRAKS